MKALPHDSIKRRFICIKSTLNEKATRYWVATEAIELGYGGVMAVSRATGVSAKTISLGMKELEDTDKLLISNESGRQRKAGGGRKKITDSSPLLLGCLEKLIEPYTSGDPMRPLRWTCKSTQKLSTELKKQGFSISSVTVAEILKSQGYSLQANYKRFEGKQHPDRNAQFEYISTTVEEFQKRGCPVISVDAKKKELVGNYKNAGKEWTKKGSPLEVKAYDFIDLEKGKVTPYGVYDTNLNVGWVNVGTDNDTAEFAVESIRKWWAKMGEKLYGDSKEILILADGGGSNGSRNRLWKKSLQKWAQEESLTVMVCHFPPGTSKWNKIEHRMFCHVTQNWRGKPLLSHEVIIELISSTTTSKGLKIMAELDTKTYPKGIKVTDKEMSELSIDHADFHGEWNYFIKSNS